MKRATKCPSCGVPVSVFAAGCAICGTDLEQHRRELEARRLALPSMPAAGAASLRRIRVLAGIRFDTHLVLVGFVLLATLVSPFIALIVAAAGAQDRCGSASTHYSASRTCRWLSW